MAHDLTMLIRFCVLMATTAVVCHTSAATDSDLFVVVLGVAQDGGYPQAGCQKSCCALAKSNPAESRYVSCIAVVDNVTKQRYLFDCTPDFPGQLELLDSKTEFEPKQIVDGIFLTHAHVGHYTGLIHLGREVVGANRIRVHGTERMNRFLVNNGPWSQLVKLKNILPGKLKIGSEFQVNPRLKVTPFQVPHRDEFTDTVGFRIKGPGKTVVYLPDIDKWNRWNRSIEDEIKQCDLALIDGTFMSNGEIPGRNMSEIPHPFIDESLIRFSSLENDIRRRIKFIHLNHTNPALRHGGDPKRNATARRIYNAGMGLAIQGESIPLD